MSPGSSPPPQQQEPSLRESNNSDSTRNTIRTVPYSPPKLEPEVGSPQEAESSGAAAAAAGASRSNSQPDIFGPYRRKGSIVRPGTGSELSSTSTVRTPLAGAKGKAVSGTKPGSDSSGSPSPHIPAHITAPYGSNITRHNAPSPSPRSPHDDEHTTPTKPSASNRTRSASTRARHDRVIAVHSDKTFSIVLKPTGQRNAERPGVNVSSPPPSFTPTYRSSYRSSHEGSSFDATSADPPTSSAPSCFSERSGSPTTTGSAASTEVPDEPFHPSPNYRIIGGLHASPSNEDYRQAKEDEPLPSLPEELDSSPTQPPPAAARKPTRFSSGQSDSDQTNSTLGDSANFTVLRPSSPAPPSSDIEGPSPGQANYQVLGESSDESSVVSYPVQPVADTPADSPGSRNYVVLGESSSSSASVDETPTRVSRTQPFQGRSLTQQFSQDSLVVRPLTTHRQSVFGVPEYDRPRSIATESIRPRAHSFSSISSVLTQDAPSLGNTPNVVRLGQDTPSAANTPSAGNTPTSAASASTPNFVRLGRTRTSSLASLRQPPLQPPPTWAGPSAHVFPPRMEAHAHQWSSQLSTVASESEPSERTSRHLSSAGFSGSHRLSYGSGGIRHVPSIESSMILADEFPDPPQQLRHQSSATSSLSEQHEAFSYLGSSSRSRSLSSPSPALMRSRDNLRSPPLRVVRDLDEDGDGLADLQHLRHMSSTGRFLNRQPSDRDLRSSSSSRPSSRPGSSTGSIIASSLPAWARVYYGSGERRWAPSIRSYSDDSRPVSAIPESGSPADYNFPSHLHNQRRRPRELHPLEREVSMEAEPIGIRRSIRRMTSSIWSPHLQTDRRAATFSIWMPPPTITWGPNQGPFDRRNIQVIMFALGWIFPFAWMIGALLPLPPKPSMDTTQQISSTRLDIPEGPTPTVEKPRFDDKKYLSARWWRNINRLMSVIGLLLIGAVVALIVIGLRDNWGK